MKDDLGAAVKAALANHGARQRGDEIDFRCIAHQEEKASASWNRRKDVWKCLSCGESGTTRDLARRLGIEVEEKPKTDFKIVAEYDYQDADGNLLYQAVRLQPKDFRQRRPDGKGGWTWNLDGIVPVLYRLPELLGSTGRVYIVEGEKDADRLRALGLNATTNVMGAGKWRPRYNEPLRDRPCIVVEDNDKAGRDHTEAVARSIKRFASSVGVLRLPNLPLKGDVSDFLDGGGTKEDLEKLADECRFAASQDVVPTRAWQFPRTDAGNAELYAFLYGDRVRFDHQRTRWLVWDQHRWGPDRDGQLWRWAVDAARTRHRCAEEVDDPKQRADIAAFSARSESSSKVKAMFESLRSVFPVSDVGAGWDANPLLLGAENGIVNLTTGELRSGRQVDRVTLSCGIVVDLAAECPRWDLFMQELFVSPELIAFVQRAIGLTLTGSTREQVWFLCFGPGANGKSTFLEIVLALLGGLGLDSYGADTPADTLMKRGANSAIPADLAALVNKRFVMCSESDNIAVLNTARVKSLTGGDPQTARFMRENFFTFIPFLKLWLATNHLPRVPDATDGFWRRVRLIPFLQKFEGAERDVNLKEKLMAELPGILNWAIRGAVEWHKTGLRPPASVMLATLNYRNASDQLAEFKTECCICSSGASATPASLYARYKGWAEHEGMTEKERIGRNSFLKLLEEQGFKRTRTEQERLILGIRIKESWEAQQIPESEKVSAGDDGLNSDDGSECHNDTFESDPVSLENPLAVSSREPKTASKVSFRQKVSGCDCESRHPAKEDCRDETWWEDDDENWHCGVHHAMPTDISGGDI